MRHDSDCDAPSPITDTQALSAPKIDAPPPAHSEMPFMPQDAASEALRLELQGLDVTKRPELRPTHRAVALALRVGGPALAEKLIIGKYGGELWRTLWSETLCFGPSTFGVGELVEWANALRFAGSSDPAGHVVRMIRDAAAVRLLLDGGEAEKLAKHLARKVSPVIC
jgi:hypothetical protein